MTRHGLLLLALAACSRSHASDLPVISRVPSFSMPDQRGQTVSDASLHGQTLIVDFFYATCTTSCPMLTSRMREVQEGVKEREKSLGHELPVHLVSITLDPENDTPAVLDNYATTHGADGKRWSFLSGRSADLDRIVVQGFKTTYKKADPNAGIAAIMHGEWLVLVDGEGNIRGYYAANEPGRIDALVKDTIHLAGG